MAGKAIGELLEGLFKSKRYSGERSTNELREAGARGEFPVQETPPSIDEPSPSTVEPPPKDVVGGETEVPVPADENVGVGGAGPTQDVMLTPQSIAEPAPSEPLVGRTERRNLNLTNIESPEDVKAMLAEVTETFPTEEVRRAPTSFAETRRGAEEILAGTTPEIPLSKVKSEVQELIGAPPTGLPNAEQLLAARQHLVSLAGQVQREAKRLVSLQQQGRPPSQEEFVQWSQMQQRLVAVQQYVAGATAEVARTLSAMRIPAQESQSLQYANNVAAYLNNAGGSETILQQAKLVANADDAKGVLKTTRDMTKVGQRMIVEYWVNSILSAPSTHIVNSVSNSLVNMWEMGLVQPLAGGYGAMRRGVTGANDGPYVGEMPARMYGTMQSIIDSFRVFGKELRGQSFDDTIDKTEIDHWKAWTGENMRQVVPGLDKVTQEGGTFSKAIDALGEWYVRMPNKFLSGEDQFFKTYAYRQELNALAYRTARQEGHTGDELTTRINELVNNPTDEMHNAASDYAHKLTFTEPLEGREQALAEFGRRVQEFNSHHPLTKLVVPFVRTPTNILTYSVDHTPFAAVNKKYRDDLLGRNGGEAADYARARFTLGFAVMGLFAALYDEGLITGAGPSHKGLAKHMRDDLGIQPYSIKIGDNYVSYNRADPAGLMLGAYATAAESIQYAGGEKEATTMAIGTALAFGQALSDKAYMQGVSEILSALSGDYGAVQSGQRFIAGVGSGFVPNWLNWVGRATDQTEAGTERRINPYGKDPTWDGLQQLFLQQTKGRTPWFRDDVPLRLDWRGEPSTRDFGAWATATIPFSTTQLKDDETSRALVQNGITVSRPRTKFEWAGQGKVNVMALDSQEGHVYQKYQEFIGKNRAMLLDPAASSHDENPGMWGEPITVNLYRQMLTKGLEIGRLQFMQWYERESPKHDDWIQIGSPEWNEMLVQTAALDKPIEIPRPSTPAESAGLRF